MTDRGPLQTFEIIWNTGHTERIQGHQVSYSGGGFGLLDEFAGRPERKRRVSIHGEFDGQWTLVLSFPEEDVRIIRNVTHDEPIPLDGAP